MGGRGAPERCYGREPPSGRGFRRGMFVGLFAVGLAMVGALAGPEHRLMGFLFGAIGGTLIGFALLAWPMNSDYPSDYIDKTLD